MKKVGIITIEGNKNYGNKLQNYALQAVLSNYGFLPYTIFQKKSFIKTYGKKIKRFLYIIVKPKSKKTSIYKRELQFEKFSKNYLKIRYTNRKNLKKLDKIFDYYVIGSDQIWNPAIIDKYLELEILNNSGKCIAYSASIAQTDVTKQYKEKIKENLKEERIKYVSLREETGKKLVEEITKRKDIECVLDPTLLLNSKKWEELAKKPKYLKTKKFILCYFLGGISKSRKNIIEKFANENNCEIIDILNPNSLEYFSNVNEFLYLEKNAQMIFTDSFHSSVFGFIFNTPFYIFKREGNSEDMSSRLIDFVNMFKLEDRYLNDENFDNISFEHNYEKNYEILDNERNKGLTFIKQALDINK